MRRRWLAFHMDRLNRREYCVAYEETHDDTATYVGSEPDRVLSVEHVPPLRFADVARESSG
jgi:hypothetical protein